jgi:hypothetical protein
MLKDVLAIVLFSILCRKKHSLDSGSERSDEFLLYSSDGSNATPKGNFTLFVSATFNVHEHRQSLLSLPL